MMWNCQPHRRGNHTTVIKNLLIACAVLTSVTCQPHTPSKSQQPELTVAAAASLTHAFADIGSQFTSQTGTRVIFSFGATADLARQIQNGAPFDVFAAADTTHVDQLESEGLLTPGSRALYARGQLVMWLPAGSMLTVKRIEDITAKEFDRIAVAKPDVAPYGQATVESLKALGLWAQIEPRVIYGQNVSQTKQFATTGNAEVAFIPLALVKPGEGTYLQVDEKLHRPIDQALGIIKASRNQTRARQFVDFVLSAEGQEILSKKGFRRPTAD
jgi:molybdate transport system substrate-binding protein